MELDPTTAASAAAGATAGVVAAAGTVRSAGKTMARVLGPSVDEVAEALRRWTAFRVRNAERVAEVADAKTPDGERGAVPPRVALRLLEEGSYSDDEVVIEYLGGVLASSRTPGGKDDRGVGWAALVARLSRDQLRLHYILYSILRKHVSQEGDLSGIEALCEPDVFLSWRPLCEAMEWESSEEDSRFQDALYGLLRENLIDEELAYASCDTLRERLYRDFPSDGVVFGASRPGLALYMWGHGKGQRVLDRFGAQDEEFRLVDASIAVPADDAVLVSELPRLAGSA